MQKPIYALIKEASEKKTQAEQIAFLQANANPTLHSVLAHALDKSIKFDLPEGTPPYTVSEFDDPLRLYQEARKFYIFVVWERQPKMPAMKREKLWIDLLESLNKEEAELVCAMKEKRLPYPLTVATVQKAFPGLINEA